MSIEIHQFYDTDGGGSQQSWYAYGHADEAEFALALADFCLDHGDDVPAIRVDRIEHSHMWKVPDLDGGWTASFSEKPRRGATAVTLYNAEIRRGGISCAVEDCDRSVHMRQYVPTVLTVDANYDLRLGLALCNVHSREIPGPSYRLTVVPVGAIIQLPKVKEDD